MMNRKNVLGFVVAAMATSMMISSVVHADDQWGVKPGGMIKFDTYYDTTDMFPGDFVLWNKVQPTNGKGTGEFGATANQSRFYLDITAPQAMGANITGKLDIDFYSNQTVQDNKPVPELRNAWMKADWANEKFYILTGQAVDLIQSVYLVDLNYGYLFYAGNPGYRRAQIQVGKGFGFGESELWIKASANRPTPSDSGLAGATSSNDSGSPTFEGRVSFSTPLLDKKPATFSITGSKGSPRVWSTAAGSTPTPTTSGTATYFTANQWSVGADLNVPIAGMFNLAGGYWKGADMRGMFGLSTASYTTGISQGEEGGWVELVWHATDALDLMAAYGYDHVLDVWNVAAGSVVQENVPMLIAQYSFNKQVQVGFEWSQWATGYTGAGNSVIGDRYQLSTMLYF